MDFFGGPHLSRFDLNNMISTHTKTIFMEKMAQICQVSKKKNKNPKCHMELG
jgi:hypothetical protein